MIITKKLVRVCNSLGIIVDKPIVEKLKLKKGDFIQVNIKKVEE